MTVSNTTDCGMSTYIGSMVFTTRNTNVELTLDPQCKKLLATLPCVDVTLANSTTVGNFGSYLQFAMFLLLITFLL